jgi:RimJ/RimL family protein N-acetyltransferase
LRYLAKLAANAIVTMSHTFELSTPRLLLRQWKETDRIQFAALCADSEVMRFFAAPQAREASDRSIDIWTAELVERGWSNWAVEVKNTGAFIGFVGLSIPRRALPFMPCVEVGYRLAKQHWGQGYATEAAQEALRFAFEDVNLNEIVSFTAKLNLPSQTVMRRLGMVDSKEDFEHPALPEGSPLRPHCLYRLSRQQWAARGS